MGRVFSTQEVASGKVPGHHVPIEVGRFLLDALFDNPTAHGLSEEEATGIPSGMVFGSVAMEKIPREKVNRRSDVDVLVHFASDNLPAHLAIYRVLKQARQMSGVHIEDMVCYDGFLDKPRNHLIITENGHYYNWDDMFVRHLWNIQTNYPAWSRNNPIKASRIAFPVNEQEVQKNSRDYLLKKRTFFERSLAAGYIDGQKAVSTLQKALELPRSVARQVTAAQEGEYAVERAIGDTAWGLNWLLRHNSLLDEEESHIQTLLDIDTSYTEFLEEVLTNPTSANLDAYDIWLKAQMPIAINLAGKVALHWAEVVERLIIDQNIPQAGQAANPEAHSP